MPWIVKSCELCKKEFRTYSCKSQENRFCSRDCVNKNQIKKHKEKHPDFLSGKRVGYCKECGKPFWKRHVSKVMCNPECYRKYRHKHMKRPEITCVVCQKNYRPNKAKSSIKICSDTCRDKYYYDLRQANMTLKFATLKSIEIFGIACEKCGKTELVDCHHIDCNSSNNPIDGSNWMRLCKSCHKIAHVIMKKQKTILSRDEIKKLVHKTVLQLRAEKQKGSLC